MIGGNGGCGGRQLRQLRNPFCLYQNIVGSISLKKRTLCWLARASGLPSL